MAFSAQISPLERFVLRNASKPVKGEEKHRVCQCFEENGAMANGGFRPLRTFVLGVRNGRYWRKPAAFA